ATALASGRSRRWYGSSGIRREDNFSYSHGVIFALDPLLKFVLRWRYTRHSHEGRAGDTDAGKLCRRRVVVFDLPLHNERRIEHVAKEAQPGHDAGKGEGFRFNLDKFDFKQVAGLGSFDQNRT